MKTNRWQNLVNVLQGLCVLCMANSALATSYTNYTDWAGANWTLANGDVVSGVHTNVGIFTIPSGATVTVQGYDTNSLLHGRVRVYAASADIQGTLSADAKGYPGATGPGKGTGHAGGGYGGLGGQSAFGLRGSSYGNPYTPDQMGSGGGFYKNTVGVGGGVVILKLAGILTVGGTISANGGNSAGQSGAGSGGSVWLAAETIQGSGLILADGGTAEVGYGGGGGGRIALDADTNNFTGTVRAKGQVASISRGRNGTLNFESDPAKHLVISSDIALPPGTSWVFASLLVTNNASFDIQSVTGSVVVAYADEIASRLSFLGNVTVATNAIISADCLGYAEGNGPGAGPSVSGGGYGGQGGVGITGAGGTTYGTNSAPDRLGSGGGTSTDEGGSGGGAVILDVGGTLTVNGTISSDGGGGIKKGGGGSGGCIWLIAEAMSGNGMISANGGNKGTDNYGGGGGGGRIMLDFGKGEVVKETWLNPVSLPESLGFTGTITVDGGIGYNSLYGADGSILLRNLPPPQGTMVKFF
jgi:hypothetical protein